MNKQASLREDLAGAIRSVLGSLSVALVVGATVLGNDHGIPWYLLATGCLAALGSLAVLVPRDPRAWRIGRIAAGLAVGVSTVMLSAAISAVLGSADVADGLGPYFAHFLLVACAGGVGLWAAELRLAWDVDRTSRQRHSEALKAMEEIRAAMPSSGTTSMPSRSARVGWPTWSLAAAWIVAWNMGRRRRH